MAIVRFVRLVGIAVGSLTAGWLIIAFVVAGVPPSDQPFIGLVVLGGLIYADIRRRDRPPI